MIVQLEITGLRKIFVIYKNDKRQFNIDDRYEYML
jgi:hypothetical protein